jgi:hypothetical protein
MGTRSPARYAGIPVMKVIRPTQATVYTCEMCGEVVSSNDRGNIIVSRGYWFHAPCTEIAFWRGNQSVTAFPSPGKLIPSTILHDKDDEP